MQKNTQYQTPNNNQSIMINILPIRITCLIKNVNNLTELGNKFNVKEQNKITGNVMDFQNASKIEGQTLSFLNGSNDKTSKQVINLQKPSIIPIMIASRKAVVEEYIKQTCKVEYREEKFRKSDSKIPKNKIKSTCKILYKI